MSLYELCKIYLRFTAAIRNCNLTKLSDSSKNLKIHKVL